MKKIISLLIALLVLIGSSVHLMPVYAAAEPPEVTAEAAILIDGATGKVLYSKNANQPMYPASTTKIMTAILAIENLDLNKTMVIDKETPFTEGARIYLEEGEEILTSDVLKSMLIVSANDSAVALAKAVGGDVATFADMMNKKAKAIGCKNTHFVNPNGLPDPNHTTTAYDLAMMAKYAMQKDIFRQIVSTYQYDVPADNKKEVRHLYNTNLLLYDDKTQVTVNGVSRPAKYDGAIGIKTGFTDEAGNCLVAGAKRGDTELISVVLKSKTGGGRFADSITLLDYGFANFKGVKALTKEKKLGTVKVKKGAVSKVEAILPKDVNVLLPIEASSDVLKTKITLDKNLAAPIVKGQKIGVVKVYEGNEVMASADAVAKNSVAEGGPLSVLGISDATAGKLIKGLKIAAILLVVLLILYVAIKRRQVKMRKKRRKEEAARRKREKEDAWNKWSQEYDRRENPYMANNRDYRSDQYKGYKGENKAPDRVEKTKSSSRSSTKSGRRKK